MFYENHTMAASRKEGTPPSFAPAGPGPDTIRVVFARKLQAAMNEKGLTQTELARRVAPLVKNTRVGRSNINKYVRAKVLPLPPVLEAIAKVLETRATELLPMRSASTAMEHPPFSLRDMENNDNMSWLQINMAVPYRKALKIIGILKGEDDEGGGG